MEFPVINQANCWYAVQLPSAGTNGMTTGWVSAATVVPQPSTQPQSDPGIKERLIQGMMERVQEMKEKYEDNPYVSVSGFDVQIGITPSLSIGFEFK